MKSTQANHQTGRWTNGPKYGPVIRMSLIALALAGALLTFASSRMPYLPGDVFIARILQAASPLSENWAGWISTTAERPWCFVLLALVAMAAWLISGWRAAALALPVFFCPWLLGMWLSPIVAQPRPSANLIQVVGHPAGYAFPSISGLVYMAAFGYLGILARTQAHGVVRLVLPAAALLLLALGAAARIILGAHWPSDLLGSYLIGLFWILVFLPMARGPRRDRVAQTSRAAAGQHAVFIA